MHIILFVIDVKSIQRAGKRCALSIEETKSQLM